MDEQTENLGQMIRNARAVKGLTQKLLAEAAGVNQSAISMLEQGRPQSLSDARLVRLGDVLGLDLLPLLSPPEPARTVLKYCTCPSCISNLPVRQDGELRLMPVMVEAPEDEVTRCRFCGLPLEQNCSHCDALVYDAAVCLEPGCGLPYVEADAVLSRTIQVEQRYREVREFFDLRALMTEDQERARRHAEQQKSLRWPAVSRATSLKPRMEEGDEICAS